MTNIDQYIARLAATLNISIADARARVNAQKTAELRINAGRR